MRSEQELTKITDSGQLEEEEHHHAINDIVNWALRSAGVIIIVAVWNFDVALFREEWKTDDVTALSIDGINTIASNRWSGKGVSVFNIGVEWPDGVGLQ